MSRPVLFHNVVHWCFASTSAPRSRVLTNRDRILFPGLGLTIYKPPNLCRLAVSNNEVYGNVNHGIIASKRCNNVTISNNEVRDGGAQAAGIFLHRSTDNAQVFGESPRLSTFVFSLKTEANGTQ